MKEQIQKNIVLGLFIALLGIVVGAVVWFLLWVMDLGISFLWEWVPSQLSLPPWYTVAVCGCGGGLVGILQHYFGPCPSPLAEDMAKIRGGERLPYDKLPIIAVCALVPLIFGGSIGPEAGLTGIIAGLCFWLADRFKTSYIEVEELAQVGIAATLGAIFKAPLFGFVHNVEDDGGESKIPKTSKTVFYFIAILSGFGVFTALSHYLGGGMGLGRFTGITIGRNEWLLMIPIAVAGSLVGMAFQGFTRLSRWLVRPLADKKILLGVIGGVALGGVAMALPYTMWSGESQMTQVMEGWQAVPAALLFATALVKLFMTNFCIETGWRGGNIFPIIFSGVCFGYGCAAMLPMINPAFCVAVATASVVGAVMRKPLAVVMLLMLCFPVDAIVPMLAGAYIAAAIPAPGVLESKK